LRERPPVIFLLKNIVTSRTIADCFATDAESIYDAFTHETWVKKGGDLVKVA
jgi:hypothetical protein